MSSMIQDFPGGTVGKDLFANARDTGSIPVQEDSTCHGTTKPMHHNSDATTETQAP